MNAQFGSGVITVIPNSGNLAANPSPLRLKVLQDASIEFKGDIKKLYGDKQVAVLLQRGKIDITGKLKIASYNANDINQLYFGQAVSAGGARPVNDELRTVGVTLTPTIGAGLLVVADQGVTVATSSVLADYGKSLLRVTAAPAIGQYTFTAAVTGGSPTAAVYGFNAAETATSVKLSYLTTSSLGSTLAIANQFEGYAPVCQLFLYNSTSQNDTTQKIFVLQLNAVMFGMLSVPTKQEDMWISDLDFTAAADASGNVGVLYAD